MISQNKRSKNKQGKKPKRKLITWRFWVFILLPLVPCVYSISILYFVYSTVWNSGLVGGGNGPADAYRHSLSSALVAHTLSPKVVDIITDYMETDMNYQPNVMDRHNNLLGANVGDSIPLSFNSVHLVNAKIRNLVDNGKINATTPDQIRFMPKNSWVERKYS